MPNGKANCNEVKNIATQEKSDILHVPYMLMVGSRGRGSGKTALATQLISYFAGIYHVFGLKVISIDEKGAPCHRGSGGCGMCSSFDSNFEICEETQIDTEKDTSKMLAAGAGKVFLLKSLKSALPQAIKQFLQLVPQNTLVVCESNSLRKYVKPCAFIFANRPGEDGQKMKASAKEVFKLADLVINAP